MVSTWLLLSKKINGRGVIATVVCRDDGMTYLGPIKEIRLPEETPQVCVVDFEWCAKRPTREPKAQFRLVAKEGTFFFDANKHRVHSIGRGRWMITASNGHMHIESVLSLIHI
jgi:hypothetical protein